MGFVFPHIRPESLNQWMLLYMQGDIHMIQFPHCRITCEEVCLEQEFLDGIFFIKVARRRNRSKWFQVGFKT